jgi:hypothetical protein
VHQVGFITSIYQDARSTKHTNNIFTNLHIYRNCTEKYYYHYCISKLNRNATTPTINNKQFVTGSKFCNTNSKALVTEIDIFFKMENYLESFEMWCWRRIERISWTNHVRN